MLTKDEVLCKMQGFECPAYLRESCWQPIHDQAVAAIDLAAENERLKAKLDAVRAECEESRQSGRRLSALRLLEIIDGGGDGT